MNFIEDVELNNYLVKLDYINEVIIGHRNTFNQRFNNIIKSYTTKNTTLLESILSSEIDNMSIIINNNNYYKTIINKKINTYKSAQQFVENKFKDI